MTADEAADSDFDKMDPTAVNGIVNGAAAHATATAPAKAHNEEKERSAEFQV